MNFAIIDAGTRQDERASGSALGCRFSTPIANLPLICHVFDELAAGGFEHARIISTEATRVDLEQVLGGGRAWGVEISFTGATDPAGRDAILTEIERALANGPVLVHPGDCLFPRQVAPIRERFSAGDCDFVLLTARAETNQPIVTRGGTRSGRVCDTPLILGPETRGLIGDLRSSQHDRHNLVESLLASPGRAGICELAEHWCYSDSTAALLAANRMLLDALPVPAVEGSYGDGNRAHGRLAISPRAQVSNSMLHGPLTIADDAVVEDSFVGPYTAIGPGVVLSGTEIDNAMVLSGAQVRYPGHRIEASIIGERASVVRSFELPKGLHLRLGPDSTVTLS